MDRTVSSQNISPPDTYQFHKEKILTLSEEIWQTGPIQWVKLTSSVTGQIATRHMPPDMMY